MGLQLPAEDTGAMGYLGAGEQRCTVAIGVQGVEKQRWAVDMAVKIHGESSVLQPLCMHRCLQRLSEVDK